MGIQKQLVTTFFGLVLLTACGKSDVLTRAPLDPNHNTQIFVSPEWQISDWDAFFSSPEIARIQFGILFGGKTPYARNNKQSFIPASNSKLFTAVAALVVLEGHYRYPTEIRWNHLPKTPNRAEGLTILGSGDPSWAKPEIVRDLMRSWAKRLKDTGIQEVQGPVTWAPKDARWAKNPVPAGWSAEDQVACYGARAYAFNWAMNCDTLDVWTDNHGRWKSAWRNLSAEVPVNIQLTIERRKPPEISIRWKNLANYAEGYVISGHLPKAPKATHPLNFSVALSEKSVMDQLQIEWLAALKETGIRYSPFSPRIELTLMSDLQRGRPEYQAFQDESMPVSEMLVPFLKQSINFLGDSLWKAMGSHWDSTAANLVDAGGRVFDAFIAELGAATAHAIGEREIHGFFSDANQLLDGSGLSRESKLTVDAVMALLRDILTDTERKFAPIWNALPIAGVDGTLSHRMRGTEAENVLRAKTGTLSGVYNLAGYIPRMSGDAVPFVILTQTTRDQSTLARQTQDEAAVQLVKMIHAQENGQ